MVVIFELIKNIGERIHQRGPTPWLGGWGARPPLLGAPLSPGPPGGPPVSIFYYMKSFTLKKIVGKLTDETPPPQGGTLVESI